MDMPATATAPVKGASTRTYTTEQNAARDYMQAQKAIDALDKQAAPYKAMKAAALDTLTVSYGRGAKVQITGCWNRPLTFTHQIADSVKWAKVAEAMRPHLTAHQSDVLDRIIAANTGERVTRTVK
jgi:predicted NAD-dependent protein-ADP-ribosyltransferase YbiA (DUF1768 family)